MREEQSERRRVRALIGIVCAACAVLLAALVPSPYAVERPGPVVDTLSDVVLDGEDPVPVIDLEDAAPVDERSAINLLTVEILGTPDRPRSWLSLLRALFDRTQLIAPVTDFYPSGMTVEQRDEQNTARMNASQSQAAAAALRHLGEEVDVTLTVAGIVEESPADGTLEPGDRLLTANGEPLGSFEELRRVIEETGEGGHFEIGLLRGEERRTETLQPRRPVDGVEPMIGATVNSEYALPRDVAINLSRIGGPSAGLAFALGIVELAEPEPLLGDLRVSATGTMSDTGAVGPIGGLGAKMWAADRAGTDLFLMPLANCDAVPEQRPEGLVIAPVATLDEAIAAVREASAGGAPPGLERCDG